MEEKDGEGKGIKVWMRMWEIRNIEEEKQGIGRVGRRRRGGEEGRVVVRVILLIKKKYCK